ncbi:MAG TPA: hypothetical protein VFZ65_23575 [Planctomycetota bacterium]|nr:hypothetical protein [Planctomycetota bacterium]
MQPKILTASVLLLTSMAVAQTSLVIPPEYERAWGRGSTALLGGNTTRTQFVYANPFPAGTTILGISFRPTAATADRAAFTADMEIRCSSSTAVPGALSTTWTSNIGNDEAVVLPQQTVNIPAMPANRGTGAWAQVLFQNPFVFGTNGNTNLVVDVLVFARSAGASWSTDRAFASTNGRAATAGIGCGSATVNSTSSGGTYVAGSTVNFTLSGAPAGTIALFVPSIDMKEFAPGALLPFPLALIGAAPGCDVLVNPMVGLLAYVVDATGAAAASVPVPLTYSQAGLAGQWLYLVPPTPANTLGIETTANRAVWIGPEVCVPNYQYVWNLSSVTSTTASNATTDSIPIVELLIQ